VTGRHLSSGPPLDPGRDTQPDLPDRCATAVPVAHRTGRCWEEMHEVARTPPAAGSAEAVAQQFGRWPRPADDWTRTG